MMKNSEGKKKKNFDSLAAKTWKTKEQDNVTL